MPIHDPGEIDALETVKRQSLGQALLRTARLYNEQAVASLQETYPELRASHTALFPYVDLEGTRITVLAQRMGLTKQAVGQLIDDLERHGVVERLADPSDGRAKLVRFTRRGLAGLHEGIRALGGVEARLRERLGDRRVDRLKRDVRDVLDILEEREAEKTRIDR